jgi:hypothetical protein
MRGPKEEVSGFIVRCSAQYSLERGLRLGVTFPLEVHKAPDVGGSGFVRRQSLHRGQVLFHAIDVTPAHADQRALHQGREPVGVGFDGPGIGGFRFREVFGVSLQIAQQAPPLVHIRMRG